MAKRTLTERQKETLAALKAAIALCGTQPELARRLNVAAPKPPYEVKQQHVWNWLKRDMDVPPELVLPMEAVTGISRHKIRRDIYPMEEQAA